MRFLIRYRADNIKLQKKWEKWGKKRSDHSAHIFAHDPCKNRVLNPKFRANRTSGSGDIANQSV